MSNAAEAELTVAEHPSPRELATNFIDLVSRAASDPGVDVAKMERLLSMQLTVMERAAEASFNQAFARLQPQLPRVTKNGAIILKDGKTQIRYAKYGDIWDAVGGLLAAEGFTVSYNSQLVASGNLLQVTVTLRHIDGHHGDGSVFLPLVDDSGAKNRVQGAGSIYAYGKRYALSQFLNIITEDEDDDGMQGAMRPITDKQQAEIRDMIEDSGADEERFLTYMGIASISEILTRDYGKAISALQQRKRQGGGK
jgi:hypothetical protein